MTKWINFRCCRLLGRPYPPSRPSCSRARISPQRWSTISSGHLLRYIQVWPTLLRLVKHVMLMTSIYCSIVQFIVFLGGADTVRLSRLFISFTATETNLRPTICSYPHVDCVNDTFVLLSNDAISRDSA